ncbi:MAG: S-layer homology domain-containing protein, partial [Snowella sp.]
NALIPNSPVTFNDLDQVAQPLRDYIQDLGDLGILTPKNGNNFQANAPITRQEYARWLVAANNQFYATSPSKQIRLGNKNTNPAFTDVPPNHPDFPSIQGLAEAGLIPSPLSNDASAVLFRPDAILNRENLIAWKVPLDSRKALPNASMETLKETWGFQDTAKIDPKLWRAIYGDFQNGEQANIRRVFGFTTLFQPKKPVTRGEAAAAIGYFGFQGDGLSARDVLGLKKATPSN